MTVELVRAPHLWARALAATVLVMAGATGAHTWAGGHLPGLPGLLALAGVVFGGGLLALRGTVTTRLLLPFVALAQAGLHGVFGVLGASTEHAAHASGALEQPAQWSWQMLVAHALGTLLTAVVWWLCDRALVAVLVAARLRQPHGVRRPRVGSSAAVRAPHSLALLLVAPRRGPPVVALGA